MKPSINNIFSISNLSAFQEQALAVFHYQAAENEVYRTYLTGLKTNVSAIQTLQQIPFLPISFFKTHTIVSGKTDTNSKTETFSSSGTTGMIQSKHVVTDVSVYEESYRKGFAHFYGDIKQYAVLALLPSYLERDGSSLIYMANDLIALSGHPKSGFYLNNYEELVATLKLLQNQQQPTILLGVTYALMDLVEQFNFQSNPNLMVMETGGMKGKRKEMIREELHEILCKGFGVQSIHSEYGMTELLSQAYSKGNGIFECPPWMQVMMRDTNDPFSYVSIGKTGGINVIDLANFNSCSFIATQDLGKINPLGNFEVLGRFDNSDIRGCNLMVE